MQDKFQQLVAEAEYAVFVLVNEETGDFALIGPQDVLEDASRMTYGERGLSFGGVFGLVSGKPKSALSVPLDDVTITNIAGGFTRRWAAHFIPPPPWCCTSAPG